MGFSFEFCPCIRICALKKRVADGEEQPHVKHKILGLIFTISNINKKLRRGVVWHPGQTLLFPHYVWKKYPLHHPRFGRVFAYWPDHDQEMYSYFPIQSLGHYPELPSGHDHWSPIRSPARVWPQHVWPHLPEPPDKYGTTPVHGFVIVVHQRFFRASENCFR